jgi:hypothetical protein
MATLQTRPDEFSIMITGDRAALESVTELIVKATTAGVSRGVIRNEVVNTLMRIVIDCTDSMPGN